MTDTNKTITGGEAFTCCICGRGGKSPIIDGYQTTIGRHNPWPIVSREDADACEWCQAAYILPARMMRANPDALLELAMRMEAAGCTPESVAGVREMADAPVTCDDPDGGVM